MNNPWMVTSGQLNSTPGTRLPVGSIVRVVKAKANLPKDGRLWEIVQDDDDTNLYYRLNEVDGTDKWNLADDRHVELVRLPENMNQTTNQITQSPTKENIPMSQITDNVKDLTLNRDNRLLRKHGLENADGTPTEAGRTMLLNEMWNDGRPEMADLVRRAIAVSKEDDEAEIDSEIDSED